MEIKVGDWVRFFRDGKLIIGVVEYITHKEYLTWDFKISTAWTNVGGVSFGEVLEVRSPKAEVKDA